MKKIILDIETTGLHPLYGDKITCICAKEVDGSENRIFSECHEDEYKILFNFFEWVRSASEGTILITANGKSFDIPLIIFRMFFHRLYEISTLEIGKILTLSHFDVLNDTGVKRISLNELAKIYSLPSKSADGLQAIKWFENNEYDKIKEYCMNDVLLTEGIYETYMKLKGEADCSQDA